MRAIAAPQMLHGAIESGFNGERHRNLWRIDWLDANCYLLVVSEAQPDFTHIAEQFGFLDRAPLWETKDYDTFLSRIAAGQIWQFRLRANPVHAVKEKGANERGKLLAHVTIDQQKNWLLTRSTNLGFSLEADAFDVVHSEWKKFSKGEDKRREVSFRAVSFEGVLTITDANLFRRALVEGVGHGKAYGMGMMTIVKPSLVKAQDDTIRR